MERAEFQPGDAYRLKREGKFGEALQAYAYEYSFAHKADDLFIREVCFDQMVDVCLLDYLRQRHRFEDMVDLKEEIQVRLIGELKATESYHPQEYRRDFDRSWAKFAQGVRPRTRPFSVASRDLVLPKRGRRKSP